MDEELLVVGGPFEHYFAVGVDGTPVSTLSAPFGVAYILERAMGGWTYEAYLKPTNAEIGLWDFGFGMDVACDSESGVVAVGSPLEDSIGLGVGGDDDPAGCPTGNDCSAGAIYIYSKQAGSWVAEHFVKASNAEPGDEFGAAIDIDEDVMIVGAPLERGGFAGINAPQDDNSLVRAGAAYIFDLDGIDARTESRSFGSNVASYSSSEPVLGAIWSGAVDLSLTGHSSALVFFYASKAFLGPVFGDQWILAGPTFPAAGLFMINLDLQSASSFDISIPANLYLNGVQVITQAVHIGGLGPPALSNALDLSLGN